MNRTQGKQLTREVKSLFNKRDEYAIVSKRRRIFLRSMASIAIWTTALSFGYGIYLLRAARIIDAIYILLWAVSILCGGVLFWVLSQSPPKDRGRLDNWFLWRGRLTLGLGAGVWIIQVINQMLPTEVNFFGEGRYIIVVGYMSFAVFLLTVTAVLARPELFLAEHLTGFASGCLTFGLVTSPVRFMMILPLQSESAWLISALLLLVVVLPTPGRRNKANRLNYVQLAAISMISPPKLLQALRTHDEVIRDQYQALIVKRGLEKDLSIGIQKELARLFVEDRKKDNEVLRWIVPTAIFLGTVLAQLLIDDLLYEDVIKPFLCGFIKALCE